MGTYLSSSEVYYIWQGSIKNKYSVLEEETNSYFNFLGEIYLIFHVNNSKNRDFEI